MVRLILERILFTSLALATSVGVAAQEIDAILDFNIGAVTTCVGEGYCAEVMDYNIYVVGGGLLDVTATGTASTPYAMNLGEEVCFTATAFNGEESTHSQPSCVTVDIAAPDAPVIISIPIRFN
jgi:hypothetical protein